MSDKRHRNLEPRIRNAHRALELGALIVAQEVVRLRADEGIDGINLAQGGQFAPESYHRQR